MGSYSSVSEPRSDSHQHRASWGETIANRPGRLPSNGASDGTRSPPPSPRDKSASLADRRRVRPHSTFAFVAATSTTHFASTCVAARGSSSGSTRFTSRGSPFGSMTLPGRRERRRTRAGSKSCCRGHVRWSCRRWIRPCVRRSIRQWTRPSGRCGEYSSASALVRLPGRAYRSTCTSGAVSPCPSAYSGSSEMGRRPVVGRTPRIAWAAARCAAGRPLHARTTVLADGTLAVT